MTTRKLEQKRLGTDLFATRGVGTLFGVPVPDETKHENTECEQDVTSEAETVIKVTPKITEVKETTGTFIISDVPATRVSPVTPEITPEIKKTPKTSKHPAKKKVSGKPVTPKVPITSDEREFTPTRGLQEGWERHTYVIRTKHVELLEAAAFWGREDIKTILDEALDQYFAKRKIKPLPAEKRRERKPRARKDI